MAGLASAGHAATSGAPDPMCAQLAAFAKSADDTAHSVELKTDWGSFSATCWHGGYGPGIALCDWLLENTSREFQSHNVQRALACVGDGSVGPVGTSVEYIKGRLSTARWKAVPDVELSFEFSAGVPGEPPLLKISTQRWIDDEP